MDTYILILLTVGLLLLFVPLGAGWVARLPLSYALVYLLVGVCLGAQGIGLINLQPGTELIERLTELVVIVSIFSCGLKVHRPLNLWDWRTTVRLIGLLMPLTILAIAVLAHGILEVEWGAAILLGAILAPTDPVLASEVQLAHHEDRDELRFGLTSEGGLNDALAFPFVYFGLHWLADSNVDNWFTRWFAVDLVWAIAAGITMGLIVANTITWLERQSQKHRAVDEEIVALVALGTILLTYSFTELINGYGFLAVFVAGLIFRRRYRFSENRSSQLELTEQLERLLEVGVILLLGSLLRLEPILQYLGDTLIVAGLLLFVIRPLGVWLSTLRSGLPPTTRLLLGWFGIRGVGSLYYLAYALGEGVSDDTADQLSWITYLIVFFSVILHGISATPLMNWYERQSNG